jgi:hypothetical protein
LISEGKAVDGSFIEALSDEAAKTLTWLADRRGGAPVAIVRAALLAISEEYLSKSEREEDGLPKRKRRITPPYSSLHKKFTCTSLNSLQNQRVAVVNTLRRSRTRWVKRRRC